MDDEQKYIDNRVNQQVILFSFIDELQNGYMRARKNQPQKKYGSRFEKQTQKKKHKNTSIVLKEDLTSLSKNTSMDAKNSPHNIKIQRDLDVGNIYYSLQDLNVFLNGLDPLILSMLQPYIRFTKEHKGKKYVLDLENANRASLRSFISGSRKGKGSIGSKREVPGGFGIKDFDLEYLVNKESKYLFNLYKMHVDFFFGSQEDMQANIGTVEDPYSPLDVLIAFPDDVKRFQMAPGMVSNNEVSNAYKVSIEVGYHVEPFAKPENAGRVNVRDEIFKNFRRNNGIDFAKFKEIIHRLRFKIEGQVYKWDPKFDENGNINFGFDFFGYDRGVGASSSSNVLLLNSYLEDYKKLVSQENAVDRNGMSQKEKKESKDASDAKINKEKSNWKKISVRNPYSFISFAYGIRVMRIEKEFLSKSPSNITIFRKGLKDIRREYIVHDQGADFENLYDFKKIMNDSKRGRHITVERKGSFLRELGDDEYLTDYVEIPYFFVGELLHYISWVASANLTEEIESDGSKQSFLPPGSFVEFVLGRIPISVSTGFGLSENKGVPVNKRKFLEVNIGAIPISWDLFLNWWHEKVNSSQNFMYKLEEFLQDFFGYFLGIVLQSKDEFHLSDVEIGTQVVMMDAETGKEPQPNKPKKLSYYIYENSFQDRSPLKFYIGNRRGMAKKFNFSVEDDQHLNSYMMATAVEGESPDNNLQTQRAMYNVDIELFGNTILQPGMMIEVVPTIVGSPLQKQNNFKNLYDLGIGGYYNVVSAKVSLKDGIFITNIHAKYYGKPFNKVEELKSLFFSALKQASARQKIKEDLKNVVRTIASSFESSN